MSTRSLGLLALLLALLLGAVGYLTLRQLGHLERPVPPDWRFENLLLRTPPGTWAIFRSVQPGMGEERYLFSAPVGEPARGPNDMPDPDDPFPPWPHYRIGVARRDNPGEEWTYAGMRYALLGLLGAKTPKEWIEEIRLVREVRPDGSRKPMLVAAYGQETGASVAYFYDPSDPDPAARGFGWVRREAAGGGQLADVEFAFPDGRMLPR